MKTTAVPIPFAGSILTDYRHVCAFFTSPKEEYQTLLHSSWTASSAASAPITYCPHNIERSNWKSFSKWPTRCFGQQC